MAQTNKEYTIPEVTPELERGPVWLRQLRKQAREEFNNMPLPRRGLQLWRYTDPVQFMVEHQDRVDTVFDEEHDIVKKIEKESLETGHLSGMVIDHGGRELKFALSDELEKTGVIVTSLSAAVENHHDLVEKYLYGLVNSKTGKFEAMNGALWNDGIFVYVPDGQTVEKPLHLLREGGRAGASNNLRLLVVVGKNAELTIVDEYGGGSTDYKAGHSHANSAVEIYGHQDSRTRYVSLQRQAGGMVSFLTQRARIDKGANMLTIPLAFGAALSKQNFGVILNGEGAESNMYGLLFGSGRQHFDNHTLHHHASGQTMSNIDFKVVLRDKALSAYTGLIRIDEGAPVCEAYQENRNLLLNPGTRAETIPELEILNEEVSCSHGATLGPVDPAEIFYLASRGIPENEAIRMIVSGYVASTLQLVPADLRERIQNFVDTRLEDI